MQLEAVLHDSADQDVLELHTNAQDVGLAPQPDLDLPLDRLRLVPRVRAERIGVGRQDPARIIAVHLEVVVVPRDVDEGVEVVLDRGNGETVQDLGVLLTGERVGGLSGRFDRAGHRCSSRVACIASMRHTHGMCQR